MTQTATRAAFSPLPPLDSLSPAEVHDVARALIAPVVGKAQRMETPCGEGRMVWHVWGEGPPLVLMHGGYGSWLHWFRNVEDLGRHRTVYVADIPGLGESDPPRDRRDPDSIADAVVKGIETLLPSGQFELCGFSFGAIMSGLAAARLGLRVKAFVMVGAGGLGLLRTARPLEKFQRDMDPDDLQGLARRNLNSLMIADADKIDAFAIHMQVTNTTRAVTKSRWISRQPLLRDALPGVAAPFGGIWGELDSTATPGMHEQRDLLRSIQPDCPFEVIPDAGHWVMFEAPERFDATLLDMLDKLGSRGPDARFHQEDSEAG